MEFEELLKAAGKSDEQALGILYRMYQPFITKMSMLTLIYRSIHAKHWLIRLRRISIRKKTRQNLRKKNLRLMLPV